MPLHAPSSYIHKRMPAQRAFRLWARKWAARDNHAVEVRALANKREPFHWRRLMVHLLRAAPPRVSIIPDAVTLATEHPDGPRGNRVDFDPASTLWHGANGTWRWQEQLVVVTFESSDSHFVPARTVVLVPPLGTRHPRSAWHSAKPSTAVVPGGVTLLCSSNPRAPFPPAIMTFRLHDLASLVGLERRSLLARTRSILLPCRPSDRGRRSDHTLNSIPGE